MANIHVLDQTGPGRFRVVYHIAVPATTNSAGVAWRSAIAQSINQTTPSVLPDGDGTNGTISAAEKAQIVAGAVLEIVREEKGQTQGSINTMYNVRRDEALAAFQARYAQFGRTI